MRTDTRADWLAPAAIVLLVLVLFREALAGGVFYERDIHLIWHPQVEGFVRAVAGGALPLWDPSPAFGRPLLANPTAQVLYPLTWLNLLLRPWTYYTLFTLAHTMLTGLAFFALARRWGLSALACATGASLWVLSGPYLSLVGLMLHHFTSASYLPVVLLAAERLLETRRARDATWLGLAIGAQALGGSPDYCAFTLATAFLWVAAQLDHSRPRASLRLVGQVAVALVVAVALSAGLGLPALGVASRSARRELPGAMATYWSLHTVALSEVLLAGIPGGLPLSPERRAELFEGREPLLGSLYLGLSGLALVGAGLCYRGQRRRRLVLVGLALGGVLFALGRHAPFHHGLTVLIPPLRSLRFPVKAMGLVAFCWAGLAAFGVDAWRGLDRVRYGDRAPGSRSWRLLVVAPSALATIVAAALALAVLGEHSPLRAMAAGFLATPGLAPLQAAARALLVHAGLAVLVTGLALLSLRVRGRSRAAAAAVAALAVLDLAIAHPRPGPVAPRGLYTLRPPVLDVLGDPRSARVYAYDYGDRERPPGAPGPEVVQRLARRPVGWPVPAALALAQQMSLAPQSAGRWGLSQAFDADYLGLQPRPLAYLTRLVRLRESDPDQLVRLLRLGSVTHVVAQHRLGGDRLRLLAELPGLFVAPTLVLAVPDPLPRARVVAGVRVADGLPALGALVDPGLDLERTVLLPEGREIPSPPSFRGAARILDERADRVRIAAELNDAGYLVLADSYDPGWQVRVDGRPARLLRANLAFRAVALPAGRHRVEMVYRPRLVLVGVAVSLVTLLGVAFLLARSRSRHSRSD